jgi:amino acid permease
LSWIQLKLCSIDVKQPSFCHLRTNDECWYCELELSGIDFVSLLVYFRHIMELFQQYFFVCLFTELVYPVRSEVVSWQDVSPPVSYCIDEICFLLLYMLYKLFSRETKSIPLKSNSQYQHSSFVRKWQNDGCFTSIEHNFSCIHDNSFHKQ